ncbi:segregation/condensation protein A [Alkaliphilus sp. MSJ-5]|uniref:Segregation and condensation protein A n=1 Tax=Alkaliphilus flagellatus TaxID=2841507 RepID=A0ABS6G805_9FIRM|nr:segregation/condensation protein A [Alkaliphilus flagellatus]MBU5677536.1 segregation/condensation protein A [Alkaliphilus flagellatus]
MAYNVKIEVFEGPFDLLFHLIEKNQIDIYDIPMTEITEQYISYIEKLEELNLDITSEFLVMAATLIEIKSRMLLPIQITEDKQLEIEDLDPRDELVRRLLEYKKYKGAAEELKDKEQRYQRIYFKPKEEFIFDEADQAQFVMDSIGITDLLSALNRFIEKKLKTISPEKTIREMQRDIITIEDKINELICLLNKKKQIRFQDMFSNLSSKMEIITTFLALLELIRLKQVIAKQNIAYTDIIIELRNKEEQGVQTDG